jgi:DNA ligase (NAD+)
MDIQGIGDKWVKVFLEKEIISDVADLYDLRIENLLEMNRMGNKLAKKMIDNIESSKTKSLDSLLIGLGIKHVGSEISELLCSHFQTLDAIQEAQIDDLLLILGIGPKVANSLLDFFNDEGNKILLKKLRRIGINTTYLSLNAAITENKETFLTRKIFCITGTLETMTRMEISNYLKNNGATVTSSITKKTNFLIIGNNPSQSKVESSKIYNIQQINEAEFMSLSSPSKKFLK